MPITERDLADLQAEGIIDPETAGRIRVWSARRPTGHGTAGEGAGWFDPSRTAYYLGAVLILFALAWFAIEAWERYGGWPLAGVALAYAALFAILGERLWRSGLRVPGGLLFTTAAGMTPLFVFSVQAGLGIWPGPAETGVRLTPEMMSPHLVVIELATVAVILLVIRLRPFQFHAAALAAAAIALAIDLGPMVAGPLDTEDVRATLAIVMGLCLVGAGYLLDHRSREDYSTWLYLGGLGTYFVLFTAHHHSDIRYPVVSFLFLVTAILIRRRAFMVAGALGLFVYLVYLAGEVFRDSLMFPAALSLIGLASLLGGVRYARNQDRIRSWLLNRLPAGVSRGLPQNR